MGVKELPDDLTDDLCNDGGKLCPELLPGHKVLWLIRHGQSTGNVAKEEAWTGDAAEGAHCHTRYTAYRQSLDHIDSPLTQKGCEQAGETQRLISAWEKKPELVVCSALTRAIQTAAIMFAHELESGTARLVIRPELRECFADNNENSGRPLAELRQCSQLRALPCWRNIEAALSDEATAEWGQHWDAHWARGAGGAWQAHVSDPARHEAFSRWLAAQSERYVAIVSHWGTINNWLNRQPWTAEIERVPVSSTWIASEWPTEGIARRFGVRNAEWIAVVLSPSTPTLG
ncbi:hypothetical protein CYMTET_10558 [Cymbomonas tetramitiformis]|uniref:Phosphoglycerate mutase n=1 Tax=Cymbomonas tetramitiformis TaxID=36881 RepID=A0AAE0GP35_9CHLO|nr:hypothetical protein CYMTET_10558 [Cymbomonas tetramitiformis]